MASKSAGQWVGAVIGAVAAFFIPGLGAAYMAMGAAVGSAVGGLIDPPKGPTIVGPRLDDLSFQTSTLGAPLGRAYGTVPVMGNVVWLEGDKYREVITKEGGGGKGGGGGATYENARYYATFAVSLLRIPDATKTVALRRMWIGSNLVYDAGSDNIESIIASNSQSSLFTFYSGSDDQTPNTRWQADKGINAVSGFPGRCYIVIYDLDLEPYSRSLAMAQVKCELAVADAVPASDFLFTLSDTVSNKMVTAVVGADAVDYMLIQHDGFDNILGGETRRYRYGEVDTKIGDITISLASGYGYTAPQVMPCHQCKPGDMRGFAIISLYLGGPTRSSLVMISGGSYIVGDQVTDGDWNYGSPMIFASDAGEAFATASSGAEKVLRFVDSQLVAVSSMSIRASSIGYSDNYVFVADYTNSNSTTCVIHKFDRSLTFVETLTLSANGSNAVLQVVGDAEFFIKSGAVVSHCVYGEIVQIDAISRASSTPIYSWFAFRSGDQPYGISVTRDLSTSPHIVYISHVNVPATTASLRSIVTAECGLAGLASGDLELSSLTDSDVRGYRVASAGSVRASLELLQAAFPFDVAPSGYKLRFVSRGSTALAMIPEADLGAIAGGDSLPVLLPSAREMDTQIPYKVSVRYLDPAREYDIAEQYASRPDTASVSERTVELSLVMTGDEAAKAADVLNQKDWLERVSFGPFSLPPTWRELEPPDVVTLEHRGQAHTIRLTRAEFLPDGRIECAGVYSAAQSYTSSATAQESLTVGQSLVPLIGSTQGYLLDIPRIRSEQDVPGMSFAITGLASGWSGGVMLRSDDSGNSWISVGASNARALAFTSGAALSAHAGLSIDHGSILTVTPLYSAHTLAGVTEDQLYAHANLAAYGADGRWEIVAFKSVTDNTVSYTIKDFLRGMYGTEWTSGLHVAGDLLILLDTATVGFFGLPTSAIAAARLYRSVTQGSAIDSATDVVDTYDTANLKPLSPVDLRGNKDATTLDIFLECSRRTRWPVECFSGASVPLGETVEAYDWVFYTDSGYGTVARSFLSQPGASVTYTSSQIVSDFGLDISTFYFDVYQLSSVVGRGFPLRSSITLNLGDDPMLSSVVLLMHMNDTGLTDVKGHSISLFGGAARSATQSKFGGYSAVFDGSGDYLTTPDSADWNFGANDFTVELFAYFTANPAAYGGDYGISLIMQGSTTVSTRSITFQVTGSALSSCTIAATAYSGSTSYAASAAAQTISLNAWHHFAMCRYGTMLYLLMDGVRIASANVTGVTLNDSTSALFIGAFNDATYRYYHFGYIDEVRVTKGARYINSTYTVPTAEFPNP